MTKNKIDKFSLEKVPLYPLECEILFLLIKEDCELNQKTLLEKTKSTIGGISKAIKRLQEKELIFTIKHPINFYGIYPDRKEEVRMFIIGYDLGKNNPLILSGHAFYFEAEVNDLPEKFLKKLEKDKAFLSYLPRNWTKAYRCYLPDGVFKLIKTKSGCKLIAHFRTFGINAKIIEAVNQNKFLKLKSELEDKYQGLKIGTAEIIAVCSWQEYALQKDPIAIAGIALGIKHKKIEQSYHYPEWEEKGYNAREKIERIIALRDKETKSLEDKDSSEKIKEEKKDESNQIN